MSRMQGGLPDSIDRLMFRSWMASSSTLVAVGIALLPVLVILAVALSFCNYLN